MHTSFKQMVQSMFVTLNQRNLDWIDLFVSDDFEFLDLASQERKKFAAMVIGQSDRS